jgi:phosphoheptose isomerase
LTAIANDIRFEEIFVYPLRTLARPGDVLVTISSSGDSENVVRALAWARDNDVDTIALTGFSGGRCGVLAETHVHVQGDNYGVIEDVHQSVMHILAQYLRQSGMTEEAIASAKF